MKTALFCVVVLSCCVSACAEDNIEDGNALLSHCEPANRFLDGNRQLTANELRDMMFCIGYVRASLDVYATWEGTDMFLDRKQGSWPSWPCLPVDKSIMTGQGIRIVVKYLKDHPEKLHLAQSSLIGEAFRDAFPCKATASSHAP